MRGARTWCSCGIVSRATLLLLGLEEIWEKSRARVWRIMLLYIAALSPKQKVLNILISNRKCALQLCGIKVYFQDKPRRTLELFHFGAHLWFFEVPPFHLKSFISKHSKQSKPCHRRLENFLPLGFCLLSSGLSRNQYLVSSAHKDK